MKLPFRPFLASPCLVLVAHLLGTSALHAGSPTATGAAGVGTVVTVGSGGTGMLQFHPGDTLHTFAYAFIGYTSTDVGTVNVDGAGASWIIDDGAWIGYDGTGIVNITNGGALTINGSDYFPAVAYDAGSHGTVNVTGSGSTFNTNGTFNLGYSGAATLNITQGGVVNSALLKSNQSITVANQASSTATILVDGAGSQWNVNNTSFGSSGTASITVSNGGQINSQGISLARDRVNGTTTASSMTITGVDSTTGAAATVNAGVLRISSVRNSASDAYPTVTITNGGVLNSTQTLIGTAGATVGSVTSYGTGAVTVDGMNASGAASQWNVTGLMTVGATGGTGMVTVSNGGELNIYTGAVSAQTGIGDGILHLGGEPSASSAPASTGLLYIGTGGGAGAINAAEINGYAGPATTAFSTIVFNHNDSGYRFTRADGAPILISGSTQLQVLKGTTILSGADTFAGGTTISGGTLSVENNAALGSGAVSITGGVLQIRRGYSVTNSITLAGGSLAQEVSALTSFSALHIYTGAVSGGIPTIAALLDGRASADANIIGSFGHLSLSLNDSDRLSDVFRLSGLPTVDETTGQTDVFVVELKLSTGLLQSGSYLGWLNPATNLWGNAVDGDIGGTATFVNGAYNAATDFHLGTYGIDVTQGAVWAVVDHDSDFAVLAPTPAPEPSAGLLSGLGLAALASRRRFRTLLVCHS